MNNQDRHVHNKEYIIETHGVGHTFTDEDGKRVETLRNISFGVKPGEFFTILGPSGCGKSTLLRILAGMIQETKGEVTVARPAVKNTLAMVFQSFALFPWLTVYENVEFGLKMKGVQASEREILVSEHIHEIGLRGFEKAYPKDLSGGMKQRVGIARALTLSPQVLLMDEPFSALDAFTADKLRAEVLKLWLKDNITVIMVTHLVDEAVEMSDRVLVMTPRPGKVEHIEIITLPRPRNKRSPEFFAIVDRLLEIVKI